MTTKMNKSAGRVGNSRVRAEMMPYDSVKTIEHREVGLDPTANASAIRVRGSLKLA